jgi:hypothetical protein
MAMTTPLGRPLETRDGDIATPGLSGIVRIVATNEAWLTGRAGGIGGPIGLFPDRRTGSPCLGLSAAP